MRKIALAVVALIAVLHVYIAWFEMFAWTSRGPKVFKTFPQELFEQTVAMAANQGIYNAFLASGLFWALLIKDVRWQQNIATFFLGCVTVAGIVAVLTVALRPGLVQIIPACIALILLYISRPSQT
jgi:putative membrane protein